MMIPYTAMSDYVGESIDEYEKTIHSLKSIERELSSDYTIEIILLQWGWQRLSIHNYPLTELQGYRYSFWFNSEYNLRIDVFQENNTYAMKVNWHLDGGIKTQKNASAFAVYSVLKYGGNAVKAATEFVRHRPKRQHLLQCLNIDPKKLSYLPHKSPPPPPLLPRKLYGDSLPTVTPPRPPVVQPNPTQTSRLTVNENNQLTAPYSSTDFTSYNECQTLGYFNNEGDGIPIGHFYYNNHNTIRYKGDSHLITIAPTGSGKNTAVQVPTLLEYNASTLIIDPKGECAIISARYRKQMGHEVIILNPFNVLQNEFADIEITQFHGFNPLAHFNADNDNFVADVSALSEAIVVTESKETYWSDSARDLISCLIMYVCIADEEQHNRHLVRVRELLTQEEKGFLTTMMLISESDFLPMAQKSRRFLVEDEKSNSSIIATAITQTLFLDEPKLKKNLTKNDFNFLDMKTKPMTVYIILPAKFLLAYSRWFRLLVTSALDSLMSTHKKSTKPVLIILDEFPILGYLSSLETAIGLARGYGIQLWIFIQDIHQLNHIYGNRAESFLANTGVQQYFTPNDMYTAERISKRMGDMTIGEQKATQSMATGELKHLDFSLRERPLMYPIDVIGFEKDLQIIFFAGNKKPVIATKNYYYQNNNYVDDGAKRYDNNPYYS